VLKNIYRKYTIQIGLIGFIIGLVFLIISALGVFLIDYGFVKDSDFLQGFFDTIGNYIYWLFIGMVALTIAGGWIFIDLSMKLQKFNTLIKTTSKATFVRNQNEIEELAWRLGPKYMDEVSERKHKFRIRN
jgi:hypothetical protein